MIGSGICEPKCTSDHEPTCEAVCVISLSRFANDQLHNLRPTTIAFFSVIFDSALACIGSTVVLVGNNGAVHSLEFDATRSVAERCIDFGQLLTEQHVVPGLLHLGSSILDGAMTLFSSFLLCCKSSRVQLPRTHTPPRKATSWTSRGSNLPCVPFNEIEHDRLHKNTTIDTTQVFSVHPDVARNSRGMLHACFSACGWTMAFGAMPGPVHLGHFS